MNPAAESVLSIFTQLSAIPRCSKHEAGLARWLMAWAQEHGFSATEDEYHNVCITVPAKDAADAAVPVVLQGHTDMVCEKTPSSSHDFSQDGITIRSQDGWLTATETTLGADNGIAVAMALAVAADPAAIHPPLELLFTVEEETGLVGAQHLKPGRLTGRYLLNIDSEDEGVFTIGCAGGRDTDISLPIATTAAPDGDAVELVVGGLEGGHSGIDIIHNRGNANVLLARILYALSGEQDIALAAVEGGNAHNAIPRDAKARLIVPASARIVLEQRVAALERELSLEYRATDPGLRAALVGTPNRPERVLSAESAATAVRLMLALPHGVIRMSDDVRGLVETSTNFATIRTTDEAITIKTSQRSSSETRLAAIGAQITAVAELAGATWSIPSSYPPWEPNPGSALLERCKRVYLEYAGSEPVVDVIHAGLECGVIGATYPGMEMISFGPNIKHPHSPDERLELASLERVVDFTYALLRDLAAG